MLARLAMLVTDEDAASAVGKALIGFLDAKRDLKSLLETRSDRVL